MSKREFHNRLVELMHHEPFVPFAVELRDGRRIEIKKPPLVWDDGAASFIDLKESALVEFFHNEVEDFVPIRRGSKA